MVRWCAGEAAEARCVGGRRDASGAAGGVRHCDGVARQIQRASFEAAVASGDAARLELAREAWAASAAEGGKGTCIGPFTVEEVDGEFGYGRWRGAARFVSWQGKWRACDDFRVRCVSSSRCPIPAVGWGAMMC